MEQIKRKYRHDLEFVFKAIAACRAQSLSLFEGAELLFEAKNYPLALANAVLALEEVGKLFLIDGLLFARSDDRKSTRFIRGAQKHGSKLRSIGYFPTFVSYLLMVRKTLSNVPTLIPLDVSVGIARKSHANAVKALLQRHGDNFKVEDLDKWKQKGFYSHTDGSGTFVTSAVSIDRDIAEDVLSFARPIVGIIGYLLDEDGMDAYKRFANGSRSTMSEADHTRIEEKTAREIEEILGPIPSS